MNPCKHTLQYLNEADQWVCAGCDTLMSREPYENAERIRKALGEGKVIHRLPCFHLTLDGVESNALNYIFYPTQQPCQSSDRPDSGGRP